MAGYKVKVLTVRDVNNCVETLESNISTAH